MYNSRCGSIPEQKESSAEYDMHSILITVATDCYMNDNWKFKGHKTSKKKIIFLVGQVWTSWQFYLNIKTWSIHSYIADLASAFVIRERYHNVQYELELIDGFGSGMCDAASIVIIANVILLLQPTSGKTSQANKKKTDIGSIFANQKSKSPEKKEKVQEERSEDTKAANKTTNTKPKASVCTYIASGFYIVWSRDHTGYFSIQNQLLKNVSLEHRSCDVSLLSLCVKCP